MERLSTRIIADKHCRLVITRSGSSRDYDCWTSLLIPNLLPAPVLVIANTSSNVSYGNRFVLVKVTNIVLKRDPAAFEVLQVFTEFTGLRCERILAIVLRMGRKLACTF